MGAIGVELCIVRPCDVMSSPDLQIAAGADVPRVAPGNVRIVTPRGVNLVHWRPNGQTRVSFRPYRRSAWEAAGRTGDSLSETVTPRTTSARRAAKERFRVPEGQRLTR